MKAKMKTSASIPDSRKRTGLLTALTALIGLSSGPSALAADPVPAKLAQALEGLYGQATLPPAGHVTLDVPPLVEDGAHVPVTVIADLDGTRTLRLLVERNPNMLAAEFLFSGAAVYLRTRLKMAEASNVHAIVSVEEHRHSATTFTRVSPGAGGCSIPRIPTRASDVALIGKMRMRARNNEGRNELAILIRHPMETGLRKDAETGELLPADYIQELQVLRNGKLAIDARLGTAVSSDPLFVFSLPAMQDGDEITVSWRDNRGRTGSERLRVAL